MGRIAVAQSITTNAIDGAPFCVTSASGASVSIPFTYIPNTDFGSATFTAELSDASGNFTNSVTLNTIPLDSDGSGNQTININIPAGTPTGSGYRIRVISSSPTVTGTDNGTDLTITLPPSSTNITPNIDQTINTSTDGTQLTVDEGTNSASSRQWGYRTTNGGAITNLSGETGTTYTPNFATADVYYIVCKSTFGSCGTVISEEVKVTVEASTISGMSFSGSSFCAGETVSVSFNTTGTFTGNFEVELSDGNGNFGSATMVGSGASSPIDALLPANTATENGYKLRVVSNTPSITSGSSSAFSVTLVPASISIAPAGSQTINNSTNGTTLTVSDGGATGRQWGYRTTSGGTITNLSGETGTTYTPNLAIANVYYVVCKSTFVSCGTVVSNEVAVTVVQPSITTSAISGSPFCVTASTGATVSVPFTETGTFTGTFTAQLSDASGSFSTPITIGTSISSPISATIPAGTPTGNSYRIRVISSSPSVIGGDNGTNLSVTLAPSSTSVIPNTAQNINTSINGMALTVNEGATAANSRQWGYRTTSGGAITDIGGQTATTYTPNFATAGVYYVVCSSVYGCATIISNEVTVTVVQPSITTNAISGSPFCLTTSVGISVSVPFTATGFFAGNTFTAQLSNAAGSFATPTAIGTLVSNSAGSQTINATIPANTATGTGYRIRVSSNGPTLTGTDNGTDLTITLSPATISITPNTAQNINPSTPGTILNVSGSGAQQWGYRTISGGAITDISGATGASYTPNFAIANTYYVVCRSTFGSCTPVISNEVKVTVLPQITTNAISGSPFCVTALSGTSVSVPFTANGNFTGNTFTAQLSSAAGSFATPTAIGTLASNANGNQTINATIPASTATGAGYRIRVVSSSPVVTGSDNGTNLSISLASISIAPTANQTINFVNTTNTGTTYGINGTQLTATAGSTPISYQWKYGTASGSYPTNVGTNTNTYTPNFASAGTYYVVCVATFGSPCSTILTSNEVRVDVVLPKITTNAITGAPFCVTSSMGVTVSIPFTTTGSFPAGNTFIARISNASGSFSSPISIGTGTTSPITATIPASIPAGNGYKIQVISTTGVVVSTVNSTPSPAFTINLTKVAVTSSATQDIFLSTSGTILTEGVTSSLGATTSDFQWKSATVTGGPYSTTITGQTGTTYIPSFTSTGTRYVVCTAKFTSLCGSSNVIVTSNEVRINVLDPSTYYRSKAVGGNWSSATTWEKWNGTSWVSANAVPANTTNVLIQTSGTVTLDVPIANQEGNIVVQNGATLLLKKDLSTSGLFTVEYNATVQVPSGSTSNLIIGIHTGSGNNPLGMYIEGNVNVTSLKIEKSDSYILSTGVVNVQQNFTSTNNGDLNVSGRLNIGGNWIVQNGNTETTTSDVNGNGFIQVNGCVDPTGGGNILNIQVSFCVSTVEPSPCATAAQIQENPYSCQFTTLPIKLVDFSAKFDEENQRIKLDWITTSEINNDYFIIEHSADARTFQEIQRIQGAGNSRERLAYTAYDENPLSGLTYYRLKQTDYDGHFTYSKMVSVQNGAENSFGFQVAPNPFDGREVSLLLRGANSSFARVIVMSSLGQFIHESTYSVAEGQSLTLKMPQTLPGGLYWVKVVQEGQVAARKVVVVNQ